MIFSTQKYMNEFMNWIDNNNYGALVDSFEITGSGGFAAVNMTENMLGSITELFEDIIFDKAGMAKASEKLKGFLCETVFIHSRAQVIKIFENYIAESDHVNLEGFVTFRLEEYSALINIVLYAAVKKCFTKPQS